MNKERSTFNEKEKDGSVVIENRKYAKLSGVNELISFDEYSVCADTTFGKISINGTQLHVLNLNLESGIVEIDGKIDEAVYLQEDGGEQKRSVFGRLFR